MINSLVRVTIRSCYMNSKVGLLMKPPVAVQTNKLRFFATFILQMTIQVVLPLVRSTTDTSILPN